ncbi:hypothetical protein MPNT_170044 [Candidatus Methylacidithermus pantelleriae]|uniref:Uncharacterized protein n=1 Tax=Candidatus Methylacidithermus pantelleriae TaxID=2744239 RepID=A0A8J2BK21_9BACT|nr:hypothetical protein MPNT_170044 [Candidatus Methylacidithermus pantelleriae]
MGVRPSYWVGKNVKTRSWANLSRPPVETQKIVGTSLKGQKLVPLEGSEMGEALHDVAFGIRRTCREDEVWRRYLQE